jgi:hypothetical protein
MSACDRSRSPQGARVSTMKPLLEDPPRPGDGKDVDALRRFRAAAQTSRSISVILARV